MKILLNPILSALLAVSPFTVAAGPADSIEQNIVREVAPLLRGMPVEKVTKTSHAGLYELLTPNGILYTDEKGSFVIFGAALVDTKAQANLTAKRIEEESKFDFKTLPFADAIKTVKGDGSRVMVTFEDPNCGFCKKLQQEVSKMNNVTIYTFLIPVLGPDSTQKSKALWCASDRSAAWNGFMTGALRELAPAAESCDSPIARNLALAKRLRINATPALLFPTNQRVTGYVPAEKIESKFGAM